MRTFLVSMLLLLTMATNASAQEIYKEIKRIMQNQEVIKSDPKKTLDERKIATFKYDGEGWRQPCNSLRIRQPDERNDRLCQSVHKETVNGKEKESTRHHYEQI